MNSRVLFLFFLSPLITVISQIIEPTRVVDLWNPFGTTTTRIPGLVGIFKLSNFHKGVLGSQER